MRWLEKILTDKGGLTDGWIDALAEAYVKRGAASGIVQQLEKEWRERLPRLEALFAAEARNHDELHLLIGGGRSALDLAPKRGAGRTKAMHSLRSEPHEILARCTSWRPEVRAHASHCVWLKGEVDRFRELEALPDGPLAHLREEVRNHGEVLQSKGAIVAFLADEFRLGVREIALFMLVRGEGMRTPISDRRLDSAKHAVSQALSDWRRHQKRRGSGEEA